MKNKNRPFFYEKKKTPARNVILTVILITGFLIYIGLQIPRIRQVIVQPLFAGGSFLVNTAKDFFDLTRMYREPETKPRTYEPLELPDEQVLFAESLESLSEITQEDPLADLRQTPTASEYSKVAEWEYLDPNLNYEIGANDRPAGQDTDVRLIPSVFERADLNNDGAAILSALLRYWGEVENQYHIAEMIHPNSFDPSTGFTDIQRYVEKNYPEYKVFMRFNGNRDTLSALLYRNIPVLMQIEYRMPYAFWLHDDRINARYVIIHGYDDTKNTFAFQDAVTGNALEMTAEELLADWYPFQRAYMVIYPDSYDEAVREALSEDYYEELNNQKAEAKFRTDSEMLPENPFAQYNYAMILHRIGDEKGSWDFFQKAVSLSLPQRFISIRPDILEAALRLGYADDIDILIDPLLRRNSYDEVLLVYRGWADILRGNVKEGGEVFHKAENINPNNEKVRYAVKYNETMIQ